MKIAILGAGHGGHGMAADLSMGGHEIRIYEHAKFPGVEETLKPIKEKGGISATVKDPYNVEYTAPGGGKTGFAKVSLATTDVKDAIKGAELINVVVPAFAQKPLMEEFIPHLVDDQVVVFHPGNFGALECVNLMKKKSVKSKPIITEAECMIYACRRTGPAAVWIKNYKEKIKLAALPASKTAKAHEVISKAYPVYSPATNVLDTSLNNINFVLHPVSVLLNVVKIEQQGAYKYAHYDATPSVGRVMEAVDNEKIALTKALGMQPIPTKEILARYYGAKGNTFYEALVDCKTYKTQTAPDSTKYRYVSEDIPFGHVPMASIGEQLKVQTPTIKALITLASIINRTDYWSQGRTAERLGLSGMSAKQIVDYVTKG